MKKVMSDGITEDLIRAFVQAGCAEIHQKTLVEKFNAQLENGLTDDVEKTADKLTTAVEELSRLSELRRDIMRFLFDTHDGDKDFHCLVKHLGIGAMTLFEAYQASDDDPELLTLALEANKRFIFALTQYLGMEITECAACFADLVRKE